MVSSVWICSMDAIVYFHYLTNSILLGGSFTKWKTFDNSFNIGRELLVFDMKKNLKRKTSMGNEPFEIVKKLKYDRSSDDDQCTQFATLVAFRLDKLRSDYTRCLAQLNIHKALTEAEISEEGYQPSAPPFPSKSLSHCSEKTLTTTPADEIFPRMESWRPLSPSSCESKETTISKDESLFTCAVS